MNKFLFKSTEADFKKLSSSIDTIQKNVLYLTYQTDFIHKIVKRLDIDKGLQKQVDQYFEDDTSQTDQDLITKEGFVHHDLEDK